MTLAYVPADIPKIPYSEEVYWEFFKKDCYKTDHTKNIEGKILHQRDVSDYLTIKTTDQLGKGEDEHSVRFIKGREYYWTESALNELPELITFLEEYLPLDMNLVAFTCNSIYNFPHRDIRIRNFNKLAIEQMYNDVQGYEPTSFRCFMSSNGRNDSFFVASSDDDGDYRSGIPLTTDVNIVTTKMPEDTDIFLFNQFDHWHGAYVPPEPKLLLFITGFIKPKEHLDLIQRSVKKYPEYIVSF